MEPSCLLEDPVPAAVSPLKDGGAENDDLFDLEFAVPEEEDDESCNSGDELEEYAFGDQEGRDLDLALSDAASAVQDSEDSDELLPPESISKSFYSTYLPVATLLNKSATKFRVFLLGFKKTKTGSSPMNGSNCKLKLFTVKFKVEEVPIVSLFTRDSSKSSKKPEALDQTAHISDEHRRFSKEVVQKYLKKVKPLYVKVSKRHVEKQRSSSGQEKEPLEATAIAIPTAVAASGSGSGAAASNRRDDSLLQQQDGIQGAILHCKRSFNAS